MFYCLHFKTIIKWSLMRGILTPAPPDSQGRIGDRGRKTGKSNLAAGELIRYAAKLSSHAQLGELNDLEFSTYRPS